MATRSSRQVSIIFTLYVIIIFRCKATLVTDLNTIDLVEDIKEELCNLCGDCPAMIYSTLRRRKVDLNRWIKEAAFNVPEMEEVWTAYHSFINQSKTAMKDGGLLIDIHGHGHTIQRAELGYLISGSRLDTGQFTHRTTSIRHLAEVVGADFEKLLRGEDSFGALLQLEGYDSVPSPQNPGPAGAKYFIGGYITQTHGSRDGGTVDAIQIESPKTYRRSGEREKYGKALARTIKAYMETHYSRLSLPWLTTVGNPTSVDNKETTHKIAIGETVDEATSPFSYQVHDSGGMKTNIDQLPLTLFLLTFVYVVVYI